MTKRSNPSKTPVQKMWEKGRKQGRSEYEIATAITERWPDTREAVFLIYTREERTVFTRVAQYLIKEGMAVDYEYVPRREVEAGDHARGRIEMIDRETPLPGDKLQEILDDVGWSGIEVYDDEYIWPANPQRKRKRNPKKGPSVRAIMNKALK